MYFTVLKGEEQFPQTLNITVIFSVTIGASHLIHGCNYVNYSISFVRFVLNEMKSDLFFL